MVLVQIQTQTQFLQASGNSVKSLWPYHSQSIYSPPEEQVSPLGVPSLQGLLLGGLPDFLLLPQKRPGRQRPSLWFHDLGRGDLPEVSWKPPPQSRGKVLNQSQRRKRERMKEIIRA